MKQRRLFQFAARHILRAERMIGARMMQKYPVNSRQSKRNCIGSGFLFRDKHSLFGIMRFQYIGYNFPKRIIPDLAHQGNIRPEKLHGQSRIGYSASCMYIRRPYVDQLARNQYIARPLRLFS